MRMKKLGFILLFFCGIWVQAQTKGMFTKNPIINMENWDKQTVYWGFYLGFNSFDYKIDYDQVPSSEVLVKSVPGFNVGLVGNLRLHEYFDLRFEPGLYYAQRNLTYPGFSRDLDAFREVKSTYIDFPLLLKFSSLRTGNVRPYLIGGFSSTLNLSSNSKSQEDNYQQKFRVKTWTRNYQIGAGIDIYFEYFKFSPSIRGVFGMDDELIRDKDPNSPWTGNINALRTRAILINFTFH